jgi:hypothetical protein
MSNWKELIQEEMEQQGETFEDVVECTLTDEELLVEFDSGFGWGEGAPFTLWTTNRVYFPVVYDGAEWVGSVSRNPDGKPTYHLGGQ